MKLTIPGGVGDVDTESGMWEFGCGLNDYFLDKPEGVLLDLMIEPGITGASIHEDSD